MDWPFFSMIAGGTGLLAAILHSQRSGQQALAAASGLRPVADLAHVPPSLQRTALWRLADGGFEQRAVYAVVPHGGEDVEVTAFDLETLRERRGEWAFLPVATPFRIAGLVSVVVCGLDRSLPHTLFKRAGGGDDLRDDGVLDRLGHIAKVARTGLGLARSYAAELPDSLPAAELDVKLPKHWRAYGGDRARVVTLLADGLGAALAAADQPDLVVELLDQLVVVYPANGETFGARRLALLAGTAMAIVDGVIAATPRAADTPL